MSDYEDFDHTQYIPGEYDPPSDSPRRGTYYEDEGEESPYAYGIELMHNNPHRIENNRRSLTWGGKREGAGSGGKREGAGRRRTTLKAKIDPSLIEFLEIEAAERGTTVENLVEIYIWEARQKWRPDKEDSE